MKEIIIATRNKGKVNDFKTLFKDFSVLSLLDLKDSIDVEETGSTFKENAIIKAEAIANQFNRMVLADDSGLSIDALGGKPGVYSARYAGENKNDEANINKVLKEMEGIPWTNRSARFHCALALANPSTKTIAVEGTCEGKITLEPIGDNGFGYDPIFFIENHNKTMAQLTTVQKNDISHRNDALQKLTYELKNWFEN